MKKEKDNALILQAWMNEKNLWKRIDQSQWMSREDKD
jgi:hypothetical protein